jgi:FKBP-type peptidyl-prolyl cis-trans isomerase 2
MAQAKDGDTVRIHYTGKLKDGQVFDSSRERGPLEVTLGGGQLIKGFESAVLGMTPGETKNIDIPAAHAYGERSDGKVLDFSRSQLPEGADPQVGQQMQLQTSDGRAVPAVVTRVSESQVTVDANHPLAGRDLKFDLELVEIL